MFLVISGCSVSYSESAKTILEPSTENCSSVELYNSKKHAQLGHQALEKCVEKLTAKNGQPKNLKMGKKEIWQCLSEKGFSILETCR